MNTNPRPVSPYLNLVAETLEAGLHEKILRVIDGYQPSLDHAHINREAELVVEELRGYDIDCPASLAEDVVLMRCLMIPTRDDALGLVISRIWICVALFDDQYALKPTLPFQMLGAGLGGLKPAPPQAAFTDRMFGEVAVFCDPEFLGLYRSYFYSSIHGALLESTLSPDADDPVDIEYVRQRSGCCEFWFLTLHFAEKCLDFRENMRFFAAGFKPMVQYLNCINDALSCYKEALDEADFKVSTIYRTMVREHLSYPAAWQDMANRGLAAYRRILELADGTQRPYLENYLKGYIYWHFHANRYGWRDLAPRTSPQA